MNILPVLFQTGFRRAQRTDNTSALKEVSFDAVCAAKAYEEAGEPVIPELLEDGFCFSPVSDGNKSLTDNGKKLLSAQYDVTDMTMEEKHQLLGKLTVLGALSGQDLMSALERDTGMTEVLEDDVRLVSGTDGVFTAGVAYGYDDDIPLNWVEKHQELATKEFQSFVFSRQQGTSTMGIGGELDSRIASLLRQLVRQ